MEFLVGILIVVLLVRWGVLSTRLRVIEQQSGLRQPSRPPRGPFELFDPG